MKCFFINFKFKYSIIFFILLLCCSFTDSTEIYEETPKKIVVIYNRIHKSFNQVKKPPILKLSSNKNYIAKIAPYNGETILTISKKAYEVCLGFGTESDEAIAAILSHELTHYYKDHGWCLSFGLKNDSVLKKIFKKDKLRQESEADLYGGIYSLIAGYNTTAIYPQLLDKLYKQFNLPNDLVGQPTKKERKDIYNEIITKLLGLTTIFETSQILYSLHRYSETLDCYEYIFHEGFPSKEMYNNAGVAALLMAIRLFENKEVSFIFPVEFDAASRLPEKRTITEQQIKLREHYLAKALNYFTRVSLMDVDYLSPKLNLACVNILYGNYYTAIESLNKMLEASNDGDIYVTRGIAYANLGIYDKAKIDFQLGKKYGSINAAENLKILSEESKINENNSSCSNKPLFSTEQILSLIHI